MIKTDTCMFCSFSGDATISGREGTAEELVNFIPGKQFASIINNLLNPNYAKNEDNN